MKPILVDARGHLCPVPSLMLKRALMADPQATMAVLMATDPMARIDVPHLMMELGGKVCSVDDDRGVLTITVSRPAVPTD